MSPSPLTPPHPLVQINFYPSMTTLTRFEGDALTSYIIDIETLALHLNDVTICSGLLPANIIAWGRKSEGEWLLGYFPASRRDVQIQISDISETLTVPFPAALLLGYGQRYEVFAIKQRPTVDTKLYRFPAPNVHANGSICRGSVSFPTASAETLQIAYQLFLGSGFNSDYAQNKSRRFPKDIMSLWRQLAGKQRFPLRELVADGRTVSDLLR